VFQYTAAVPNPFSFINSSSPASQSCGDDRCTSKRGFRFLNHESEHHSSALASSARPAPRLSGGLGNGAVAGRLAVFNMSIGSLSISCCMPTQRFALRSSACCLLPDACCTRTADGHSCSDCILRLLFHNSTRRPATPPLCRSLMSHHPLHELFSPTGLWRRAFLFTLMFHSHVLKDSRPAAGSPRPACPTER